MAITDNLTGFFYGTGTMVIITMILGIILILGVVLAFWVFFKKGKWNIKTEFKMIRSDGKVTMSEWGKGFFDTKNGIIWIKRKGMRMRKEGIKAQRIDQYLQGGNILTVVGNPGNWRPVINDSFTELIDDATGEVAAVVNLRADTKEDKSWAVNFERAALQTFSVANWMQQYGQFLGWGFLILIVILGDFIGFSLLMGKLK